MRYVRIWHGGADVGVSTSLQGSGNEINGLTLAGVRSGTTLEYIEVAFNLDDGFELFGGAVNGRYLSSIYNKDDAFDTDQGYQGKLQFIFALLDEDGNHAAEMDGVLDATGAIVQPRSYPQVYGATFAKANHSSRQSDGLMRLREGTGGEFGNIVLLGRAGSGVQNQDCAGESRSSTSVGASPDSLFFSQNNIINTKTQDGSVVPFDLNCTSSTSLRLRRLSTRHSSCFRIFGPLQRTSFSSIPVLWLRALHLLM